MRRTAPAYLSLENSGSIVHDRKSSFFDKDKAAQPASKEARTARLFAAIISTVPPFNFINESFIWEFGIYS